MSLRRTFSAASVFLLSLFLSVPADAVLIADFDFESVSGDQVPNNGIGPAGMLLDGASVANGVLTVDGLGSGLDIPLGALSPFNGDADWSVQFDFRTEDEGGGPLFSSDNSVCEDECNDAVAAGAVNIFITGEGEVTADAWFIGAIGAFSPDDGPLNDGEFHTVKLDYTADVGLWELYIDDLEEAAISEEWPYIRESTLDRTRIGDQTNPDFGFEAIDPGEDGIVVDIDNFRIDAPSPPPVLLTVNRDTGEMVLENISGERIDFNQLSISSRSGALTPDEWISFSTLPNSPFTVDTTTPNELTESADSDGGVDADFADFSLGNLWVASPIQDVRLEIFDTGLGELVRGAVSYTGEEVVFADLDSDGELTPLDWDAFVAGYGSNLDGLTGVEGYFLADLNTDGIHNGEDFIAFAEAYDAANGEDAFAEMRAASVPEPEGIAMLGIAILGMLSWRRRREASIVARSNSTAKLTSALALTALSVILFAGVQPANAELLARYEFDDGTNDTSGNGRDGDLDPGFDGNPSVSGGLLNLTGQFEEGMIVPLGDNNPFDGSKDFTIDLSFSLSPHDDEAGHLLLGSANENDPSNGDNRSLALFVNGEGEIFFDTFFVGDVVASPEESVIDEQPHSLRVTYVAPEEADEAGTMWMRVDDTWLGVGEIAPGVPDIGDHEVRLGGSLNDEFPFECEGSICAVRELLGEVDELAIYDEAFAPRAFQAEVNRANGDIVLRGGEFARDISFYELTSDGNALNPTAWTAGNLDQQNVDALGEESGQTWDTLDGKSSRVAEAFLTGSTFFEDGVDHTLAGAWAGGPEDLELSFVTSDMEMLSADVIYIGEGNGNPGGGCNPNTLGDLDGSGDVAFADFLILSQNFGQAATDHTTGDIDCSGDVAFADFLILSQNFGQTVGGAQVVPEPSGWILGLPIVLLGLMQRQKR